MERRRTNAAYLLNALKDLQEYLILPSVAADVEPSWFGFLISVKPTAPFTKQELVEYLENNGIGTRQLFAGNLLRQPAFVDDEITLRIGSGALQLSKNLTEEDYKKLPNTDFIMNNTFWIGTFQGLDENDLSKTSEVIHNFIKAKVK